MSRYHDHIWKVVVNLFIFAVMLWASLWVFDALQSFITPKSEPIEQPKIHKPPLPKLNEYEPKEKIRAYVTGYNSHPSQTSGDPCVGAGGYICGRTDVVACPRRYELGTKVKINGKEYECLDRLSRKYDARFDLFCDQDFECPYEVTGWEEVEIL